MIGDESLSSPNVFVTKPYFQWRNILSPNMFFSNINRLGEIVFHHHFFFFFNFNRLGDELFRHQFLLIVRYSLYHDPM